MEFKQVGDILDWSKAIHAELAERYQALAGELTQQRAVLLLDYLADHQKQLEQALAALKEDVNAGLLNTWTRIELADAFPSNLMELRAQLNTLSTSDILNLAISYHDRLIALYRELSQSAELESSRELFRGLADLEHHDKLITVRDAQRLEDY